MDLTHICCVLSFVILMSYLFQSMWFCFGILLSVICRTVCESDSINYRSVNVSDLRCYCYFCSVTETSRIFCSYR